MTFNREALLFAGLALIIAAVFPLFGPAYSIRMLVEAACYALLALGLTIQWGYAGLFNAGIMGFVALGGFMSVFISYPANEAFWATGAPADLGILVIMALLAAAVVIAISQLWRIGLPRKICLPITLVSAAIAYLWFVVMLDPVTRQIEAEAGFIGGLGLPVWLGWIMGGVVAGLVAWGVGHICLGLRSDYLAIATLGISEIIKSVFKNADWLTKGTLTVSPLPWPVPTPNEIGFVAARSSYLAVLIVVIVAIYLLLQRAYHSPWGRMMRAIRDNETAAAAMGKNINRRRLEIFILGCVIMGIAGAALISFSRIFNPSGFLPLNHTFLIWVMVILGGAGNNRGAIFGAIFVYIIWIISEPGALILFDLVREIGASLFDWQAPDNLNARALQMRVFVIGLTITLVLRFAPNGLLPEKLPRHDQST